MPRRACSVVLSIGLLGLAIGPVASQSGHHGHGHAENHDWYQQLKQPGTGYSCCKGTVDGIEGDCRPTRAYQTDDGTWRALINGRWVPVPPRAVLQQLADQRPALHDEYRMAVEKLEKPAFSRHQT